MTSGILRKHYKRKGDKEQNIYERIIKKYSNNTPNWAEYTKIKSIFNKKSLDLSGFWSIFGAIKVEVGQPFFSLK